MVWKEISGYEGLYEVSDTGLVRSLKFGKTKILRPFCNGGYMTLNLCKDGKAKCMTVHRLVAEAFIQNPNKLPTVNHRNENKLDNSAANLEWLSMKDNNNYGTHNKRVAEANVNNPKRSKQVQMFDKQTGELLATFPSIKEAERQTGIAVSNICHCCNGNRKMAGGFIWKYS